MTMQSSTLRPGLLVSLATRINGGVSYSKRTIESAHLTSEGAERARWETERTIADAEEFDRAKVARSKARNMVTGVCAASAFGLLCPESRVSDLEEAVSAARRIADEFNAGARLSRVSVYVITGRIAPDDVEAVRAINSEVRELLAAMADGVRSLDPKAIRDAADRARNLGAMLSPEAAARVSRAIEVARSAARKIVKAGEQAAGVIDAAVVRAITDQRVAFLDFDDAEEVAPAEPAVDGRALDLAPVAEMMAAPAVPQFAFEME